MSNDVAEGLDQVAEKAVSDRGKQADLINVTFTIVSGHQTEPFKIKETIKEEDGSERVVERMKISWIADVLMSDGTTAEYWMDGAICSAQMKWLAENKKFPCQVRLTKDGGKQNNAYKLSGWLNKPTGPAVAPVDAPAAAPPPEQGVMAAPAEQVAYDTSPAAPQQAAAVPAGSAPTPEPAPANAPNPAAPGGGINAVLAAARAKLGDDELLKFIEQGQGDNDVVRFVVYDGDGNMTVGARTPTAAQEMIVKILEPLA